MVRVVSGLTFILALANSWIAVLPSQILHCADGSTSVTSLPANRTLHLRAEAKSGTTWYQQLVFQLLTETCAVYDAAVDGIQCHAVCVADKLSTCPQSAHECPIAEASKCRTLRTHFTDSRNPQLPLVSHVTVLTANKHAIPFIRSEDHPNKTPVLRGLPKWLETCIVDGHQSCTPPTSALDLFAGLSESQTKNALAKLYPQQMLSRTSIRSNARKKSTPAQEGQGILSIHRDPRSVTTSAAHYNPGLNLFGPDDFKSPEAVNTFVQATINMTTGWTQFRRHWFTGLNEAGVVPVFQTFYEDLVNDATPEMHRLAHFLGICYNADVVANVTHQNSQEYYEENGLTSIQHVPMVRPDNRPKDVITGFLDELDTDTLRVANNTMIMTLAPELLERWMRKNYVNAALHEWDAAHNSPPSIIKELRKCCGPEARSKVVSKSSLDHSPIVDTSSNKWRAGECIHSTQANKKDSSDRDRSPTSDSLQSSQHSESNGRDVPVTSSKSFRADGVVNEGRLEQWLLSGINFLSKPFRERLFAAGSSTAVTTDSGQGEQTSKLSSQRQNAIATAQHDEEVVRRLLRGDRDDDQSARRATATKPVSKARQKRAKTEFRKTVCTPLRHLL